MLYDEKRLNTPSHTISMMIKLKEAQKIKDYRETVKEKTRSTILKTLEKEGNLTFKALLEETHFARSTLSIRLKDLLANGKIQRFYNTYRITEMGNIETQIKSMIQCLGLLATYRVFSEKGNIKNDFAKALRETIEGYVKATSKIPAKEYMEYLKEIYPLEI